MSPYGNQEKVRGGRPPAPGIPGAKFAPKAAAPTPEPEPEPDADDMGADYQEGEDHSVVKPNPKAVYYRTEAETCDKCTYYGGGDCQHPMVAMPVEAGASCSAFEAGAGGAEQPMGAEEMPAEEEEPMPA